MKLGNKIRMFFFIILSSCILVYSIALIGMEKCERNVLPLINNLLENREINLPDGRPLDPHLRSRFQARSIWILSVGDLKCII